MNLNEVLRKYSEIEFYGGVEDQEKTNLRPPAADVEMDLVAARAAANNTYNIATSMLVVLFIMLLGLAYLSRGNPAWLGAMAGAMGISFPWAVKNLQEVGKEKVMINLLIAAIRRSDGTSTEEIFRLAHDVLISSSVVK